MSVSHDEILDWWFADSSRWFKKDPDNDRFIRERFGPRLEEASRGELDHWREDPDQCLALVILLDQFSRNVHRDTPMAFAQDERVQAIVLDGLARGYDRALPAKRRAFFYMPLMHAEDRALQARSVDLFAALKEEGVESFYDYAVRHREIIDRFGRFPHRNALLGRPSTPEERSFLEKPGSSF